MTHPYDLHAAPGPHVDIDADPSDPRRTVVRFGRSGPTMSIGVPVARMRAILTRVVAGHRQFPDLDPDELGFLHDGVDGRWDDDALDLAPSHVEIATDPDAPQRTLVRFGIRGIQRSLNAPVAQIVAYFCDPAASPPEDMLPTLTSAHRSFLAEHLAQLPEGRPRMTVAIDPLDRSDTHPSYLTLTTAGLHA